VKLSNLGAWASSDLQLTPPLPPLLPQLPPLLVLLPPQKPQELVCPVI